MVPADAGAATVSTARGVDEEEVSFVYATFTAARGERNRLTVRGARGRYSGLVLRDPGSRVRARGGCKSLGPHAAKCPSDDRSSVISLGDRSDRLTLLGSGSVLSGPGNDRVALRGMGSVLGGSGNDRLSGGPYGVSLSGGRGDDVLRGGSAHDRLDGGLGRDRLYGRGDDDDLVDGETDARAARDLFDGGAQGLLGNTVEFSRRQRSLLIDLRSNRTSTHDSIVGIQNITSGGGDDHLIGDAADNRLRGGPGDDVIVDDMGKDTAIGGPGNDRLSGGAGKDYLIGEADSDQLDGGPGDDAFDTKEIDDDGGHGTPNRPDEVVCGDGADTARSDASDTVELACEQLWAESFGGDIVLWTVPAFGGDHADFTATFVGLQTAIGTLGLTGPAGEHYGQADYVVPPDGTPTTVSVPLSSAAVAALHVGTTVQVNVVPDRYARPSGYRVFLRASY